MILQNSQLFELRGFNFLIYKVKKRSLLKGGIITHIMKLSLKCFAPILEEFFPCRKKTEKSYYIIWFLKMTHYLSINYIYHEVLASYWNNDLICLLFWCTQ